MANTTSRPAGASGSAQRKCPRLRSKVLTLVLVLGLFGGGAAGGVLAAGLPGAGDGPPPSAGEGQYCNAGSGEGHETPGEGDPPPECDPGNSADNNANNEREDAAPPSRFSP